MPTGLARCQAPRPDGATPNTNQPQAASAMAWLKKVAEGATLNASSDVSTCDPANCSVFVSANENPNPCTSPKPNASNQRVRGFGTTTFSTAV